MAQAWPELAQGWPEMAQEWPRPGQKLAHTWARPRPKMLHFSIRKGYPASEKCSIFLSGKLSGMIRQPRSRECCNPWPEINLFVCFFAKNVLFFRQKCDNFEHIWSRMMAGPGGGQGQKRYIYNVFGPPSLPGRPSFCSKFGEKCCIFGQKVLHF